MRLAQGAGATGLAGIPSNRDAIRRPVILFSKDALEHEAARLGLTYVDDPSNDDLRFTRNRVRHVVMPTLESEVSTQAREGLARSARLIAEDDAVISGIAAHIPIIISGARVFIPIGPITTAPVPIAARAIRSALRHVNDGYPGDFRRRRRSARSRNDANDTIPHGFEPRRRGGQPRCCRPAAESGRTSLDLHWRHRDMGR